VLPSDLASSISRHTICDALVRVCATWPGENWSKFSFCWATPPCRPPNDTSVASRNFATQSTTRWASTLPDLKGLYAPRLPKMTWRHLFREKTHMAKRVVSGMPFNRGADEAIRCDSLGLILEPSCQPQLAVVRWTPQADSV
jgi:hypothetical protein